MTTSDSIEKETTFTPGPWTVRRAKHPTDGEYDYAIMAEINGHPRCIAEAFGRCAHDVILSAEDHAHLFAAAPDLYAVVVDFMENPNFRVAVGGNPNAVDELMARARNALAKVRGECR